MECLPGVHEALNSAPNPSWGILTLIIVALLLELIKKPNFLSLLPFSLWLWEEWLYFSNSVCYNVLPARSDETNQLWKEIFQAVMHIKVALLVSWLSWLFGYDDVCRMNTLILLRLLSGNVPGIRRNCLSLKVRFFQLYRNKD